MVVIATLIHTCTHNLLVHNKSKHNVVCMHTYLCSIMYSTHTIHTHIYRGRSSMGKILYSPLFSSILLSNQYSNIASQIHGIKISCRCNTSYRGIIVHGNRTLCMHSNRVITCASRLTIVSHEAKKKRSNATTE